MSLQDFINALTNPVVIVPWILIFLTGIGAALTVIPILYQASDVIEVIQRNMASARLRKAIKQNIPEAVKRITKVDTNNKNFPKWLTGWINHVEPKIKGAELGISTTKYLWMVVLSALSGIIIGIFVLHNPPSALIMCIAAVVIPDQLIARRLQKKKDLIIHQLASVVRMFGSEFAVVPQVTRALAITASNAPEPIASILRQAVRDLQAGLTPDYTFSHMVTKLNFEYGRLFVQLLRIAWDESAVAPLFPRLAARISAYQSLGNKNIAEIAWMKLMGRVLNIMIIPTYFLMKYLVPDVGVYLTSSVLGQLVVTTSFLSLLVGVILDRILRQVEF